MRHVYIVGSKGIPGAYGGYETFVDKLTQYHQQEAVLKLLCSVLYPCLLFPVPAL